MWISTIFGWTVCISRLVWCSIPCRRGFIPGSKRRTDLEQPFRSAESCWSVWLCMSKCNIFGFAAQSWDKWSAMGAHCLGRSSGKCVYGLHDPNVIQNIAVLKYSKILEHCYLILILPSCIYMYSVYVYTSDRVDSWLLDPLGMTSSIDATCHRDHQTHHGHVVPTLAARTTWIYMIFLQARGFWPSAGGWLRRGIWLGDRLSMVNFKILWAAKKHH